MDVHHTGKATDRAWTAITGFASGAMTRSRRPRTNRARLARAALAAVLVATSVGALASTAGAQGMDDPSDTAPPERYTVFGPPMDMPTDGGEVEVTWSDVRIVARGVDDGRTEFALQRNDGPVFRDTREWGDRLLPARRFFPADATTGRWLVSAPLTVRVYEGSDSRDCFTWGECFNIAEFSEVTVRITARRLAGGSIEFALQQDRTDDLWGERLLPPLRFFPATATVGRWLSSSSLRVDARTQPKPVSSTQFAAVEVGSQTCALRTDGAVACWGGSYRPEAPAGQFTAISIPSPRFRVFHLADSCALGTDGTITCWDGPNSSQPLDGRFTAVAAGALHVCGLRTDGTIACSGANWDGQTDAPSGVFTVVTADGGHSCALRSDGTIACWGANFAGQATAPSGRFTAVDAGDGHTCALGTDGAVTCWGDNRDGQATAPSGRFTAVDAGNSHNCALRTDGTVTCWGYIYTGSTTTPSGQFTAVSAGIGRSCGLRSDGTLVCWSAR